MSAREFERIARIAAILGGAGAGSGSGSGVIEVGIGDDAAVLAPTGRRTVWTIDAAVDGVHFDRAWLSAEDVGFRATVAAASDVLAMGARPVAALAAWTIPPGLDEDTIDGLARGQRAAADALSMAIAGGNLSDGPLLSITTTVLGVVERARAIGRDGARAGDRLVLLGEVGAAALGLSALRAGAPERAEDAVSVWRRPPVHLAASTALADVASALVDVSDGLAQDVGHVAHASGVRAVIDLAAVRARRRASIAAAAAALGVDLDRLELAGGEDYALVAAVPEGRAIPPGASVVGRFEPGQGVAILRDGRLEPAPAGHVHGGSR